MRDDADIVDGLDASASPRVTVIIPTFDWAPVLEFSIASVLAQTFTDFELLVIGDGCTDESAEVVGAIPDRRVTWVDLEIGTGHQSGPNDEGARRARGDLIAYLGHDDLWLPHHLASLVPTLDAGAPAAHTARLDVDPRRGVTVQPHPGWHYVHGTWLPPTSFALRRDVLEAVGGWRRPHETGALDPEADLLARVDDAYGPPVWVPRLTCIKLSAGQRRDVYRTRPTHEQAHWWRLVEQARDPEAAVRATAGRRYRFAERPAPARLRDRLRSIARRGAQELEATADPDPGSLSALERYRRNRIHKGLTFEDDRPPEPR